MFLLISILEPYNDRRTWLEWDKKQLKAKWQHTKLYMVEHSQKSLVLSVGIGDIPCRSELPWNSS